MNRTHDILALFGAETTIYKVGEVYFSVNKPPPPPPKAPPPPRWKDRDLKGNYPTKG